MATRREFLALALVCCGMGGMDKFARAEDGSKLKLREDVDNWAALQAFVDAHLAVQLPVGTWLISQTLVLKNSNQSIVGFGADRTTLKQYGAFSGPVIGVGAHPTWNPGGSQANFVSVRSLTAWQTIDASANNKCIWVYASDDFTAEKVRVRGSAYEGMLTAGDSLRATIRNCEAWDCGNGGPAYPLSTAGFNTQGPYLTLEDFRTLRCGQGVECGSTDQTIRRGVVASAGGGSPAYGINCGSASSGVYGTTIEYCIIDGYDDAIVIGNGLGRLAAVTVRRCKLYDSSGVGHPAIQFSGGKETNNVSQPWEGPDTEGSFILDNEIYVGSPHGGAIVYNGGPQAADEVYGREHLTVSGNRIYFNLSDPSLQTAPPIGFAGKITGNCVCTLNHIYGLPSSPARGDIASFTSNANVAVPGFPTFRGVGNFTWDLAGRMRDLSIRIEGA